MNEIASLIRDFPFGSFLIITSIVAGFFSLAHAMVNRNKPVCDCDCCVEDQDDGDDDQEVETEVED